MKKSRAQETPVYCLDTFSDKAQNTLFYIQTLQDHLRDHAFVSKPHRHDFYLALYISQGAGEHTIDFQTYPVKPHSFFLMTPGQVHSWKLDADTDGYIFFFVPEFYQLGQTDKHLLEFPFFQASNPYPCVQLTAMDEPIVPVILQDMLEEYAGQSSVNINLLRSYVDVVLLKMVRHYDQPLPSTVTQQTTFKLRRLEQLIDQNYLTLKTPHAYADLMHLSSSYLNNLCKQALNKTLSDLIHERIVLEAKRFFAYTDLTVAQVADKLNFQEPSYFIRFFRKETGTTPEQFREQLNRAV
jgi:AraC-like DNA-binding protein